MLSGEQTQLTYVAVASERGAERIALPVDTPSEACAIAEKAGVEIVWTKRSAASLLGGAHASGSSLAADRRGGVAFPAFLPAFDGVAALLHVMDHLARQGEALSVLRTAIANAGDRRGGCRDTVGAQGRGDARDGRAQ